MIELLSKLFIKNNKDTNDSVVRRQYGILCGIVGIFFNIFLFIVKYIAGTLSGSIAITADSFNNLSDAGSSLITTLGFRLSGLKATEEHPFGHGRIEYISGFGVSILIMMMSVELFKSSVEKIVFPVETSESTTVVSILIISIIVKLYMFYYNNKFGKKFNSVSIRATATDSLSDAVATFVVLLSVIVSPILGYNLDGVCGLLVSLFILKAGIGAAKDTLSPLLGKTPDKQFVKEIEKLVLSHSEIIGVHDLIVHDYGPGRLMITLHAEVPNNGDINELHDAVDLVEHELKAKLNCEATIHMDPVATDDYFTDSLKSKISDIINEINPNLKFHDFRIVSGPTHTNLIFDLVVPFKFEISDTELKKIVREKVSEISKTYYCVITIDREYS